MLCGEFVWSVMEDSVDHWTYGIVSANGNMYRHYGSRVNHWTYGIVSADGNMCRHYGSRVNHWTYGIVSADGNMCRHYGRQWQPLNIRDCVSWWKHVQTLWKTVSTIEHTGLCQLMETCTGTMDHVSTIEHTGLCQLMETCADTMDHVSTIAHTGLCQLMETCAGTMDHHIHVNSLHCWYPCLFLTRQHVVRLFTAKKATNLWKMAKQNNNTTAIWFLEHETCMSSSLPRSC